MQQEHKQQDHSHAHSQYRNRYVKHVKLPSKMLSVSQLAVCLNVLAQQYGVTLPLLIRKLDRVSGNIRKLDQVLQGDCKLEWDPEEDALIQTNQSVLRRWKGQQDVEIRKKYLEWKNPTQIEDKNNKKRKEDNIKKGKQGEQDKKSQNKGRQKAIPNK